MTLTVLGTATPLSAAFTNSSGAATDPTAVVFTLTDPLGNPTVYHYPFVGGADANLVHGGTGAFTVTETWPSDGLWLWEFVGSGAVSQAFTGTVEVVDTTGYPQPWGYADVPDVQARIKAGTINFGIPGTDTTTVQVQQFLLEATAEIDMVLARSGYTVPLVPIAGKRISPTVWTLLRSICATRAAGQVEMTRHATDTGSGDTQAERLITLADDMLARLESGADNLKLFGVAGPFEPEASSDISLATGNDIPDAMTGAIAAPQFSVGQQW